jgi:hypothetical protein
MTTTGLMNQQSKSVDSQKTENLILSESLPRFTSMDFTDRFSKFTTTYLASRLNMDKVLETISSLSEVLGLLVHHVSDEIIDYGLHIITFIYKLTRLTDWTDLFLAGFDFLRAVMPISDIRENLVYIKILISQLVADMYNSLRLSMKIKTESAVLDGLKTFSSNFGRASNSDFVTCVRDFILSLVSYKIFEKDISKKITKSLGTCKAKTTIELFEITLSSLVSILGYGERIAKGESFSTILSSASPLDDFLSSSDLIYSQKDLTYTGLPVKGKVCRREYMSTIRSLLIDGETIVKSLASKDLRKQKVITALRNLKTTHTTFLNIMNASSRAMPCAVMLEGQPGIGKGLLVDVLCRIWSTVKDREHKDTYIYNRCSSEEYWSGYEPDSQPIIHYSEPGALHINIAKARGDPAMSEFLSVCDNQPYMANMADVDSKGKVFVQPEMIIIDCNDPSMNLNVLLNNPAAVKRRLLYVKPIVKPEFTKAGTCRLDVAKSLASDIPVLDRWLFQVYVQEPVNNKESEKIVLKDGIEIYELTQYLKDFFNDHIETQEKRLQIAKDINITDYLQPEVLAESGEIDVRIFATMYLPAYLYVFFLEIFPCFITFFFCASIYCLQAILFAFIFIIPNNVFCKAFLLVKMKGRLDYYWRLSSFKWQIFRSTIGLRSTYQVEIVPQTCYYKYAAVLAGILIFLRTFRCAKNLFSEGGIVSTASESTEAEVDTFISTVEKDTGCELPEPRKKVGNSIDWDALSTKPKHSLIINPRQYKDLVEIENSISKNVRYVVTTGKRVFETHGIGVCEDLMIINRHALGEVTAQGNWNLRLQPDKNIETGIVNCKVSESETVCLEGDLWLVRVRGCKFRDIRELFFSEDISPRFLVGSRGRIDGHDIIVYNSSKVTAQNRDNTSFVIEKALSYNWDAHQSGKCGMPLLVAMQGAYAIGGIHTAGAAESKLSFSQKVNIKIIEKAITILHKCSYIAPVNSEGYLRLPVKVTGLTPISERSPLRFEEIPGLTIIGGLAGYQALKPGKSKVVPTLLFNAAEDLTGVSPLDEAGVPKFGAPPMKHKIVDGEYNAPFNHFVKQVGVEKVSLDPIILNQTIKVVSDHLISELEGKGVHKLSPITLEVAQNGFPEDYYMRAMKPSTSGGWSWPGKKSKYSKQVELPFKKDSYMPLFDVKEQVMAQLDAYLGNLDAHPLLGAQLKDEPRSQKKIKAAKTRVFNMSPYESTLVNRMYLMPFYSLMVEYSEIFSSAIGTNMHSVDVDDLVNHLKSFSDNYMEGDYSGFDTSMPYDIGLATNTIILRVLKSKGYDDKALQIVKGILSDNLYPIVIMQGDVFAAPALQPSGKYATAEDNSLRGLVMLVYAWIVKCTKYGKRQHPDHNITRRFMPADFFKFVRAKIYGDDLLATVNPECDDCFNNVTYQKICREIYGLDFTNAQKTLVMQPYLKLHETSFLKRNFKWRDDLQHWVAPLELTSIMKSIAYTIPSRAISEDDQLIDSTISALRELFFHLEESAYHARRMLFAEKVALTMGRRIPDILLLYPTFGEIRQQLYGDKLPKLAQMFIPKNNDIADNKLDISSSYREKYR